MSSALALNAPHPLAGIETPCLVLDEDRMLHNIARLKTRLSRLGVPLRPHLKTAKSIPAARAVMDGPGGPAAVSTLQEAEVFAAAGVKDILYAVGIAPQKLDRVAALRRQGVDLSVVLDSIEQATAVTAMARTTNDRIPVLIEIDCDGHRAGVGARDPLLVEIGRTLHQGGAELRGVMAHAGESYSCRSVPALEQAAEQERAAAVACAEALRGAGLPCPVVSVGSTPTAHFARRLDGVTEVRAGVFVMFDLVMAGIGVCAVEDIALSVLATVIGHRADRGWTFIDAGWMALSRDRGTAKQPVDQGYGIVCDIDGRPYRDLIVTETNQEHGIIALRPGSTAPQVALPVGAKVRILPNHACATGAQHDRYHVVAAGSDSVRQWERFRGW
ncbi:DSD1 family PLP-dependent enzyme [Bradyrhizobium sp. CCBAU 53421]|uniref:DSD1 family PLP-dependent enzyme n=1 Tax=Bradyrhizobium sp. CCBAU 53421 TaxID=1325120 RepID=UPI001889C7A5|nr:DSD1 family PLP-dependent enzyme [Bradyrhizobium sp. CCBAU 53421]